MSARTLPKEVRKVRLSRARGAGGSCAARARFRAHRHPLRSLNAVSRGRRAKKREVAAAEAGTAYPGEAKPLGGKCAG